MFARLPYERGYTGGLTIVKDFGNGARQSQRNIRLVIQSYAKRPLKACPSASPLGACRDQGRELHHPAVQHGVVDGDTPLSQDLFKVAVGDGAADIEKLSVKDHSLREVWAFELDYLSVPSACYALGRISVSSPAQPEDQKVCTLPSAPFIGDN